MPRLRGPSQHLLTIGTWLVRWRCPVLIVAFVLAALLSAGLPLLRVGFRVDGFFKSPDPELQRAMEHYGEGGVEPPDRLLSFAWREAEPHSAAVRERLQRFTAVAEQQPIVRSVLTLANARLPGIAPDDTAALSASSTFRRLLVSKEQDAVGGVMVLRPGWRSEAFGQLADDLRQWLADEGRELVLCGLPYHTVESRRLVRQDMATFLPIGTSASAVLLFWLVPHWLLSALALLVVPLTLVSTLGVMALLSIEITMLTSTLPTLLLCMSVADGLHMVARFLEERDRLGEARAAAARTFAVLFVPCLMTSLTTVLGFSTLCTAGLIDLQHLGGFAALGMGFAFLYTMTVLPAAMSFVQSPIGRRPPDPAAWCVRAALLAQRLRPRCWIAAGSIALVVCGAMAMRIETDHRITADLWPDSPIMQQIRFYETGFVGMVPAEVVVETGRGFGGDEQAQLRTFVDRLEREAGVSRTLSIADLHADGVPALVIDTLARAGALPAGLLSADGRTARILVFRSDLGSKAWQEFVGAVPRCAAELPDLAVRLAGLQMVGTEQVRRMTGDLESSFVGSIGLIFLLVWLSTRRLRLAAIAMVSCLLPMLAVFGFMAAVGITLRPLTVIAFCVALGLMIDDAIHLVARFQEERAAGHSRDEAVQRALSTAGRPIVVTTLLLLAGFLTILTSAFRGTFTFGLLVDLSLLLALASALFVLPALLRVFGGELAPPAAAPNAVTGR